MKEIYFIHGDSHERYFEYAKNKTSFFDINNKVIVPIYKVPKNIYDHHLEYKGASKLINYNFNRILKYIL